MKTLFKKYFSTQNYFLQKCPVVLLGHSDHTNHHKKTEAFNATTATPDESGMRNTGRMQHCSSQVGPESRLSLLLLLVANPYTRFQATSLARSKIDARAARAMSSAKG